MYSIYLYLQYGTKHIVQALIDSGRQEFQSILICGGLSKNKLFVQTHADVCSLPVLLPGETEAVLLGSAMLAACAAKVYPDLEVHCFLNFIYTRIICINLIDTLSVCCPGDGREGNADFSK